MATERYPLTPLATFLHIELSITGGHQPGQHPTGLSALAERLNISHATASRYHRHGLTDRQADRLAIQAGTHPAHIWPQWLTATTPTDQPSTHT